jgi:glycine/D-amino acid oxidase-like deaminating enzyme
LSIEHLFLPAMQAEILIVGQGITGTWLSYYLEKANKSFLVVDNNHPTASSRVAAGLINPVTGRRIVKTWMIDELLAHLVPAYEKLGKELDITAITQKNIIDFHPTPQMKIAFDARLKDGADFLSKPTEQEQYRQQFNYDFGYGEISPCYLVNLKEIIPAWRKKLLAKNLLVEKSFSPADLVIQENSVRWSDGDRQTIEAGKIIFCDGIASANNPFFKNLPFALNKGEALIIEAEEIPSPHIYKKTMGLVPLGENLFWAGSNYEWEFVDDKPSENYRMQTGQLLKSWLKVPFKIVDHVAAIRPANLERRPFVGFHPVHKNIGILNGMGTKGCSLAPYFAKQLAEHITGSKPLFAGADIQRFSGILSR